MPLKESLLQPISVARLLKPAFPLWTKVVTYAWYFASSTSKQTPLLCQAARFCFLQVVFLERKQLDQGTGLLLHPRRLSLMMVRSI